MSPHRFAVLLFRYKTAGILPTAAFAPLVLPSSRADCSMSILKFP